MSRACMRTITAVIFALLLLGGAAVVHAAADPFPVYDCIRPNIAFWKKVYSEYSTSQGLIHDSRNLGIVYDTVELVDANRRGARKTNRKRVERAKEKYERILGTLAQGSTPADAEEKRVAALFGEGAGPADFEAAKSRIRFQLGQKNRFREGIIRSGAFLEEIKKIIRSYDLPEDLAYLPHVESSFNPNAYSKFGAAGMWQFTQSTGKRFMTVDYTIDERRDPLRATHAAARYLQQAYGELQCWPSAITAYNYGPAGMARAKKAKGSYPRIFAEYGKGYFKFASRNFYSEFLAAREVAKNHRAYFGELKLAPPRKTSEIVLAGFAPIVDLARRLNEDLETLRELNPALREPVFAGRKYVPKGYRLRIPAKERQELQTLVAGFGQGVYRAEQKRSRFYEVRRGDTASSIARRHKVKLHELIAANGLSRRATIYVGQNLRIPAKDEVVVLAAANLKRLVAKAARPEPVAEPVQVAMLSEPQEIVSDVPPAPLLVAAAKEQPAEEPAEGPAPEPGSVAVVNPAVVTGHLAVERVVSGKGLASGVIRVEASETLGHYAEWLEIPTQALRRLNGFRYGQAIRIHQEIKVPLDKVAKEQFEERRYEYHKAIEEDFFAAYRSEETRIYQVRKGDAIWALCRDEFEVPFWLVKKYNEALDFNNLRPSQEIVIPVVERIGNEEIPAV